MESKLKLLSFNPNNENAVEEYNNILLSLSNYDKKILGDKFHLWKLGCLYACMTSSKYNTNLVQISPLLIQKFHESEVSVIANNDQESLELLYSSTRYPQYLKYICKV